MDIERSVAQHYGRADIEKSILDALAADGRNIERLSTDDLAGVDEFHLGWRPATLALAENLAFPAGARIIDFGSGIGGPARHFAESHGCFVEGVDLTDDFVEAARALTARCGLADRARFHTASALRTPFAAGAFDGAIMLHVGMNIEDKAGLFGEARRLLKDGARFGVYDVMRIGPGELAYPMPWATEAATSFVRTPDEYRAGLAGAGFAIERETNRRDEALKIAAEMRERSARHGPTRVSINLLIGATAPARRDNVMAALQAGVIAPVEIIARAA